MAYHWPLTCGSLLKKLSYLWKESLCLDQPQIPMLHLYCKSYHMHHILMLLPTKPSTVLDKDKSHQLISELDS
jgi:hypothetical protein